MRRRAFGSWSAYVLLWLLALLTVLPIFWMVRSSLMSLFEIFSHPPIWFSKAPKFSNYTYVLEKVPFLRYFINTMIIMVPVLIGTVLTGSMAAYAFARLHFPLRNFWFMMIVMTMLLPGAVTLIPTFIGFAKLGLVNTFYPLIIPAFLGGGAFNIFLIRQFLFTLPRELDESAYIDGAGFATIYLKISLPLIKPALVVVALFTFLGVWNDFLGPLIYLGKAEYFTISLALFHFRGLYLTEWSPLMAASGIVSFPVILVFIFGQKFFIEGITLSAIKG